jgi:hypothetical protein
MDVRSNAKKLSNLIVNPIFKKRLKNAEKKMKNAEICKKIQKRRDIKMWI